MNDRTVAAPDIGGGILGALVRFSWRCSTFISGIVALAAGALYWKVSCSLVTHAFSALFVSSHRPKFHSKTRSYIFQPSAEYLVIRLKIHDDIDRRQSIMYLSRRT